MHRSQLFFLLALAATIVAISTACTGGARPTTGAPTTGAATTTGSAAAPVAAATNGSEVKGDPNAGKELIVSKGCSGCHTVPVVPEAKGTVGPNLGGFAGRPQIASTLPNNPDNLTKWLKNPPSVKPGTQMPNLGLSEQEIANLEAFLYTLK